MARVLGEGLVCGSRPLRGGRGGGGRRRSSKEEEEEEEEEMSHEEEAQPFLRSFLPAAYDA